MSLQNSDAAVQIRLSPPSVSVSFWKRSFFVNYTPLEIERGVDLLFVCFGSVDSVEHAEYGSDVYVSVDADAEDVLAVGLSQFDVRNRL